MIERTFLTDRIFTLKNFLSPEECATEIDRVQRAGFNLQSFGASTPNDIRRRAVLENADLNALMWNRVAPFLPSLEKLYQPPLVPSPLPKAALSTYRAAGMNTRLRYYGYYPGEWFPPHIDLSYEETPQFRSFLTFIVYLTDGYRGGETSFDDATVEPSLGTALLFPHELRHEGLKVIEGWKCILRSDVMYRTDHVQTKTSSEPNRANVL